MNTSTLNAGDLKAQLRSHLSADLENVELLLSRELRSSSRFLSDIIDHVSRFGGKRIRPVLLLLTERLISGKTTLPARILAASVELIHTATLVHDDVIDEASTRRHVATVHRRWNTETSVLVGDYFFSRAFRLAASTGDAEACHLIGRATDRTCEGELNQIAAKLERSISELDYFRISRDKTGQLFALSCLLGARSGSGSAKQQGAMRRFGLRLGIAFQIADDVLDLTEASSVTGKDSGNDLQNGRLTLPLLRALQLTSSEAAARSLRDCLFADDTVSVSKLVSLNCVRAGLTSAAETARTFAARAVRELKQFSSGPDRQMLEAIASFAVQRQD